MQIIFGIVLIIVSLIFYYLIEYLTVNSFWVFLNFLFGIFCILTTSIDILQLDKENRILVLRKYTNFYFSMNFRLKMKFQDIKEI